MLQPEWHNDHLHKYKHWMSLFNSWLERNPLKLTGDKYINYRQTWESGQDHLLSLHHIIFSLKQVSASRHWSTHGANLLIFSGRLLWEDNNLGKNRLDGEKKRNQKAVSKQKALNTQHFTGNTDLFPLRNALTNPANRSLTPQKICYRKSKCTCKSHPSQVRGFLCSVARVYFLLHHIRPHEKQSGKDYWMHCLRKVGQLRGYNFYHNILKPLIPCTHPIFFDPFYLYHHTLLPKKHLQGKVQVPSQSCATQSSKANHLLLKFHLEYVICCGI